MIVKKDRVVTRFIIPASHQCNFVLLWHTKVEFYSISIIPSQKVQKGNSFQARKIQVKICKEIVFQMSKILHNVDKFYYFTDSQDSI